MLSRNDFTAIKFMILNCFAVASMGVISKMVSEYMSISSLMHLYNLAILVITTISIFILKISFRTPQFLLHLTRSVLTVGAYYLLFSALRLTSIANATAVSYLDPIITCLLSYIYLKEKMTKLQVIELSWSCLVAAATILWAFANIITKILGSSENSLVQIFYISLIASILTSTTIQYNNTAITLQSIIFLCLLTACAFIQYFSVYKTLTLSSASITMPFSFMALIFSQVYGLLVFREPQHLHEILGSILIISVNIFQLLTMGKTLQSRVTPSVSILTINNNYIK